MTGREHDHDGATATKTTRPTRERVLDAACEHFARGGFGDATHHAICAAAGANIAAVNYYFGSKESLYEASFERAYQLVQQIHPLPRTEGLEPRAALEAFLGAHLQAAVDPGPGGWFHRLLYHEWTTPSPAAAVLRTRYVEPVKAELSEVVATYLGDELSAPTVCCASFCLHSQCMQLCAPLPTVARHDGSLSKYTGSPPSMLQLISDFCMAGVDRMASSP